jgi:hypothetical protein
MIITNLGRVSIVPKGTWGATTQYTKLDLVSYQGSSYLGMDTVPVGTLPTDTRYWQLFAQKGTYDYKTTITTAPDYIGQEALVNGNWYKAIGTSGPSDWKSTTISTLNGY